MHLAFSLTSKIHFLKPCYTWCTLNTYTYIDYYSNNMVDPSSVISHYCHTRDI